MRAHPGPRPRRGRARLNLLARAEMDQAGLLGAERLEEGGREWGVGDRLVCGRNDYRLGVRNGTRGSVLALPGSGGLLVETDEGRQIAIPPAYLEHAQLGYAVTGHVSQGETVDRAYLLASPDRGGREGAYVAGSRHRIDLRVYVAGPEPEALADALASAWSRSQAKRLALDLVPPERRAALVEEARAELADELPERLEARLAEPRAERAGLTALLRTYPEDAAARLGRLEAEAARAGEASGASVQRAEEARARVEAVPAWRAGQRATARQELRAAEAEAAQAREREQGLRERAAAARSAPDGPEAWEAAHPGARDQYRAVTRELREAERIGAERAIAGAIAHPPAAIERTLGLRPADPEHRRAWDSAAAALARYRHAHHLGDDSPSALGPCPSAGPGRRAWQEAERAAVRACSQLGRPLEHDAIGEGQGRGFEREL